MGQARIAVTTSHAPSALFLCYQATPDSGLPGSSFIAAPKTAQERGKSIVFAALKGLLSSLLVTVPVIEPVEFSEGLLAFRCRRSLPFQALTVASRTSAGTVRANITVCSYDPGHRLYRARVTDCVETLARIQVAGRNAPRLSQAVRVSSRQIPKFFALTEDISSGGLRLATPDSMPVGAVLDMTLDLDDPVTPSIQVQGEVCWTAVKADGSHHSGVRFVGVERGQHRVLERYIENRLATQRTVHGDE